MKIIRYWTRAIWLLVVVFILYSVTTTTAFANNSGFTLTAFDAASLEFSVRNNAPGQLWLREANDLLADAKITPQEDVSTVLLQAFNQAWTAPIEKDSLLNVCEPQNTEVGRSTCLELLTMFLEQKKDALINRCYKPGLNGKLCLDVALSRLKVTLADLDRWIEEL